MLRFQGLLNRDYSVEFRADTHINASNVFTAEQELLFRSLLKDAQGDTSSLKLFMDTWGSDFFYFRHQSALADTIRLMPRPVDVIVKGALSADGLKVLQSATGKRLMYAGAHINPGKAQFFDSGGNSKDYKAQVAYYQGFFNDLQLQISERSGEPNIAKIAQDMGSNRTYNSLESLWYGNKGLVDAILLGNNVVTRDDMKQYFEKHSITDPAAIEAFNKDLNNVGKIPRAHTLATFSPESLPPEPKIQYQSLSDRYKHQEGLKKQTSKAQPSKTAIRQPYFYYETVGENGKIEKCERLPLRLPLNNAIKARRLMVSNISQQQDFDKSTLLRDTVFFNDEFDPETAQQLCEDLLLLDEKKIGLNTKRRKPSNILLVQSSPGGYNDAAFEIKNTIESLTTPVDVLVQGIAASNGAFLLSYATGKRLATPNSRIMIHNSWAGPEENSTQEDQYNTLMAMHGEDIAFSRHLANVTGRDAQKILKDMQLVDVWLTPLEALFYGPKGLLDAILVGPSKILTREGLEKHLLETVFNNDQNKLDDYIERKIEEKTIPPLRQPFRQKPTDDPFEIPLKTIEDAAAKYAVPMDSLRSFKTSCAQQASSIDYYHVRPTHVDEDP